MNALLNQDFDSESEGEEFNPAAEQDEEVAAGSDGEEDTSRPPRTNGRNGDGIGIGEDEDALNGEDDGLPEDEEDEEEEDEDEEDISVGFGSRDIKEGRTNRFARVDLVSGVGEIVEISLSISKPR